MNGYELSKTWYQFCGENSQAINTNHHALFFWIVEKANRLQWADTFGLPSDEAMHFLGINTYKTYIKTLRELIDFGFIELVSESKNQFTSNKICFGKKCQSNDQSNDQSKAKAKPKQSDYNKTIKTLETNKPINIKTLTNDFQNENLDSDFKLGFDDSEKKNFLLDRTDLEIEEQMKFIVKNKISESNIQADFFCKCRDVEINCYLEYTHEDCRFDAVLYDDAKNIYCIIEFKSYKTDKLEKLNTKQLKKYEKYNLPIIVCTRLSDVNNAIIQSLRQLYIVSNDEKKKDIQIIADDFIQQQSKNLKEPETEYPFEIIWNMYGKDVGFAKCEKLYEKIKESDRAKIFEHVPKYVLSTPAVQYRKNFQTYLNQKSFNDEIITQNGITATKSGTSFKNESSAEYLQRVGNGLDGIFAKRFGKSSNQFTHGAKNANGEYTNFTELSSMP